MKKLILTLTACALVVAGLANPFLPILVGSPPAAGVTYIFNENCDGAGTPSGWSNINTVDWDYTTSPAPLEGTQSLFLDGQASGSRAQYDFSGVNEIWVRFKWLPSVVGGPIRILSFRNQTGDAELGYLESTSSSTLRIVQGSGGGSSEATTVATAANGTAYNVWVRFKIGGGANGEMTVGFSTTTTEPTSGDNFRSFTGGTTTSQINRIQFRNGNTSAGNYFIFDQMAGDDVAIGNF